MLTILAACGRSVLLRLKHTIKFKGWYSHVHREFPGSFESNNLSRGNLSRKTGRSAPLAKERPLNLIITIIILLLLLLLLLIIIIIMIIVCVYIILANSNT